MLVAAAIIGLAALSYQLDLSSRMAIFTGLILPIWLLGGLVGAGLGLLWYRWF